MNLNYKGQNLFVDNVSVKSIAKSNITPFYLYSYKKIKNNFETFSAYFKKTNPFSIVVITPRIFDRDNKKTFFDSDNKKTTSFYRDNKNLII